MRSRRFPATAFAPAAFALLFAACSGSGSVATDQMDPSGESGMASEVDAKSEQIPDADAEKAQAEKVFWERQEEAKNRYTKADVDFMTGMISHHAQALIMSAMAPTHGASPSVRTLTARIINAQKDEIATMQQWLRDRGQPVPEVHIEGTKLMIHGVGDHMHGDMHMPGMLTDAQLEELDNARDKEFDRLFLKYMIQHHKGAVTMVDDLFSQDGAGQDEASFKLASDINVDQLTEIARMQQMLDALSQ